MRREKRIDLQEAEEPVEAILNFSREEKTKQQREKIRICAKEYINSKIAVN